jgi:hypothetical protein
VRLGLSPRRRVHAKSFFMKNLRHFLQKLCATIVRLKAFPRVAGIGASPPALHRPRRTALDRQRDGVRAPPLPSMLREWNCAIAVAVHQAGRPTRVYACDPPPTRRKDYAHAAAV